ncbi:uncharacterized protein V1518DRAFT_288050 [Limtongia smithiae]|uniref:uncharacterized protein n=1 Tax=Limtongia smithiae TaxID=1125753 RepID=UPI0034CDAA15
MSGGVPGAPSAPVATATPVISQQQHQRRHHDTPPDDKYGDSYLRLQPRRTTPGDSASLPAAQSRPSSPPQQPSSELEVFRCPVCDKKFLSKSQRSIREHVTRLMRADNADGRAHAEYHRQSIKRSKLSEEERRKHSAAAQHRYRVRKSIDARVLAEQHGGPAVIYDKAKLSDKRSGLQRQLIKKNTAIPQPPPPEIVPTTRPVDNPFLLFQSYYHVSFAYDENDDEGDLINKADDGDYHDENTDRVAQPFTLVPYAQACERLLARFRTAEGIEVALETAPTSAPALYLWRQGDAVREAAYTHLAAYRTAQALNAVRRLAYATDMKTWRRLVDAAAADSRNDEVVNKKLQAWVYRQKFLHEATPLSPSAVAAAAAGRYARSSPGDMDDGDDDDQTHASSVQSRSVDDMDNENLLALTTSLAANAASRATKNGDFDDDMDDVAMRDAEGIDIDPTLRTSRAASPASSTS